MRLNKLIIYQMFCFFTLGLFLHPSEAGIVHSVVSSNHTSYGLQPRPKSLSVCFVGNALTARTDRVNEIRDILKSYFEGAANIKFTGFGTCQPPTTGKCGTGSNEHDCDQYPGDIRIALAGTQVSGTAVTHEIPASETDCDDHGRPHNWAVSPHVVDESGYRACRYNAFIGDNADNSQTPPMHWLNLPLHEIGHALGFVHEFVQPDYYNAIGPNGSVCSNSLGEPLGRRKPWKFVFLTPVDMASVMMYQDNACGIDGPFGFSGLSPRDRISLHILYPEDSRKAEYIGTTVVKTGQLIKLTADWFARGAHIDNVMNSIKWTEGSIIVSGNPVFMARWSSPGYRTITFEYTDFLGRNFSTQIEVRVLNPPDFVSSILNPIIATTAMY